ncbi:MAG: hypothetical protein UV65_C0004G0018 [Parcubacteria group bacterium GW2011_GWF2_43_11]|nr:MAG: hypothetical protein UV65_C0004G0018 [Parcubacteria group bacterium GW2011_GWF2_43_11]
MQNKGFTLIEMVVAVAIFTLLVGTTSSIFLSSIKTQKQGLATQEILDQTSYLMEYMSRSIRMAKKDISGSCTGIVKLNYEFSGQCLKLRNYKDLCQQFCLDGSRMKNEKGEYLTSDSLNVSSFSVTLSGATQNDDIQPMTIISIDIQGKDDAAIKIQTSVSQRNLDVEK